MLKLRKQSKKGQARQMNKILIGSLACLSRQEVTYNKQLIAKVRLH
jgi:hypothetical protein